MPAPFTIVTLLDEDGDEFPIRLPGVWKENRDADVEAAREILEREPELKPRGAITFGRIEYL